MASTSSAAPAPTGEGSSGSSGKRKIAGHASRACNGCRRRRSKCDAVRPTCGACALVEEACGYGDQLDGRKAASKTYVDALHQRIRALEGMLEEAGLPHGGEVEERPAKGKEKAVDGPQGSDVEAGLEAIEMLKIDDDTGELRQYGPQSTFAHLPGPSSPEATGLSTSVGTETFCPSSFSLRDAGVWPDAAATPTEVDWARNLPSESIPGLDEQLHDHLLDLFFTYFNDWCGWTSGAAAPHLFRRDLACCLATPSAPQRTSYYSPMLHNAILALAVVYCSDPRVKDVDAVNLFASAAKAALEAEVERPMLSTLQGLMVLGSVHSGTSRHGAGYHYGGAGLRMATTLGLGIDATSWLRKNLITQETKEERERAFWFTFIQDKLWASYVGRPPTITSLHYDTPLPTVFKALDDRLWRSRLDDEISDDDDPPSVELPSYASTTFLWTAKLAILAEKISSAIYALKSDTRAAHTKAAASSLHLELGEFYETIPPAISISPHSTRLQPTHVVMLHLFYWFQVLLLHRPFFPRKRGETSTPSSELAVKSCEKAASKLIQLFQLHRRCPGLRYATISSTQICFTTGRIHLLMALHGDRGSKKTLGALANARLCVEMLDEMPWPCAKSTARDLERLIKEWNPVQAVPPRDPLLNLDAQALDPHSELAKQLRALGWTPPVAGAQPETVVGAQQQPAADREVGFVVESHQEQPKQPVSMDQHPCFDEGQASASLPMAFSFAVGPPTTQYDPSAPLLPNLQQPFYPFSASPFPQPPSTSASLPPTQSFSPFPKTTPAWTFSQPAPAEEHPFLSQSPNLASAPSTSTSAMAPSDLSMLALFESQAAFGMPVAGGWAAAGYGGVGLGQPWNSYTGWGEGSGGATGGAGGSA
ncbi:fungal-specific transcription factor domain-domain-containing protein [Leucosporidium creatinivorum]|uniref:Fungal-specific transcription factor domain-domain-containing protein n=1 Tax=Leucosporidium creatinivorum TaxID=106004 RepID=A0A1Y2F548_9BASI|nr:fungal-specific transcription factor domain-domain-containing protein [Leucosporidium creatinivorum]